MRFCWRVKHPFCNQIPRKYIGSWNFFTSQGPFVGATWICLCSSWTPTLTLNMTILAQPTTSCYSCSVVGQYYKPYLILDRRHTFQLKLMDRCLVVLLVILSSFLFIKIFYWLILWILKLMRFWKDSNL